ncbi:multidrug effflux MFS transporter [Oleiagrimonas citrea]|uniref:Bcr/CflA family efflux transporter n=1 Tax=Oleiagrimonas citrea TaxID=1665687 RepID=A0A846ZIP1_9GAMM|nr:multidrug effflux MFS transporter [Oleiagrimonas citrea]NKZ37896.1 multidrug effflux MFS transporter [Oleiagrimonas citrea]
MTRNDSQRYGLLAVLLAALSMIGPFSIDAIFPAFERIGAEFGVGADAMQQTVSVYLLAYAAMSLFHGALSDAYGRKPVIVIGMLCYGVASMGAALADSFTMLLVFRGLQGLCAGAGIVVGRAVVRDRLEGAAAQRLLARALMIFSVAPAIAPMVGAFILGVSGWRAIFWCLAGFAWLMALACALLLAESHPHAARTRFAPGPLLAGYRAIARDSRFWQLTIAATVNFSSLFLYIASAPVIVLQHLGLGAHGFPWLFVPVVIGLMGGSALSGQLAGRISARRTIRMGYLLMLVACVAHVTLAYALPQPRVPWSMLPLAVQGIGVQLAFPTLTLLLLDRFPHRRGSVSAVQAGLSLLFNAIVAGVFSPLLSVSMVELAWGACLLTAIGWVAWYRCECSLRRLHPTAGPEAVPAESEPVEPA